jgi:hypothetical protein
MKLLSTTDTSRFGNDCYIYETVNLVEQFGIYAIIMCQKITGWHEIEDIYVMQTTTDYNTAVAMYKHYGGVMEDETVG